LPDLIELGVDILQPIQPEAMDIFDLKQQFGRDICFAGGISTQRTLPYGSTEDVRSEVNNCLLKMAKGGGYIMAPAKAIMPGVPLENAAALINAFVRQENYRTG
jgi:uroporphyrinogen decarboxylase